MTKVPVPVLDFSRRRFPFRPLGRPFSSKSVGKASIFGSNTLTGSPIFESSVPIGYYALKRSARARFGFFRPPIPVPNPRRSVFEPKCRKIVHFLLILSARHLCLQVTLPSSEVPMLVLNFSGLLFPFWTPAGLFRANVSEKQPFSAQTP